MSALVDLRQAPVLGQHYSSFDDLKKVLQDWSVREKFSYRVSKRDSTRGIYVSIDIAAVAAIAKAIGVIVMCEFCEEFLFFPDLFSV